MKIVIQSRKLVKPLVPTPPTLGHYKLGFIDEFAAGVTVGVALFFSSNNSTSFVASLETSLEKILTRFYPLAGRYVEETVSVDCSDQGAEFIHASTDVTLEGFLVSQRDTVNLVDEFINPVSKADALLATQITTFTCGGIAIGASATHKVADASTLCTFINEWANINREQKQIENEFTRPGFNSSSLLPALGLPSFPMQPMEYDKYTRKKLSFSGSVLSNMKAKSKNRRWSKVQLVSAIIWKAFMSVDLAKHHHPRDSTLAHIVNLRERMASSIPKNACGNLWTLCSADCYKNQETTTQELADRLHDSIKKTITNFAKGHHDRKEGQMMILNSLSCMASVNPESTNVIFLTSWCTFPFHEADFGFGRPVWVAPGTIPINQSAYLMDTAQGNGVDAYVFLEVKDVPCFEEALDLTLKAFDASTF